MQLNNLAEITNVLPHLAAVIDGATVRRTGLAVKAYRPETSPLELSDACKAALLALVRADVTVRVYSLGSIWTLGLNGDGGLSWSDVKATTSAYRANVIVKVVF